MSVIKHTECIPNSVLQKEDAVLAWMSTEEWQNIEALMEAHNGGFQCGGVMIIITILR